MIKIHPVLALIGFLHLTGCASNYLSPDAVELSRMHRIIAVAPPEVAIIPNKKIDFQVLQDQEKNEALTVQKSMVSWLLKRKGQNHIAFDILDVATTNALLSGATRDSTRTLTPAEMCEALDVDAIIQSHFNMKKTMSEATAVMITIFTKERQTTNEVSVSMDLFDRRTGKIIWNYYNHLSGSVLSSPYSMVDNLMYSACDKMPYSMNK